MATSRRVIHARDGAAARPAAGALRDGARSQRGAPGSHGAFTAARRPWRADRGAQLHHGLVVVAGPVGVEEAGGFAAELGGGGPGKIQQPRQDAPHIAVHGGHRPSEGDAGHRARGVFADSRKCPERSGVGRQFAAMPLAHRPRRPVQVAGARVVPEAFPREEHVVQRGRGEGVPVGKPLQPARVVRSNGLDTGLLQHELRDRDAVRVPVGAPGQGAAVTIEVGQER